MLNNKSMIQTIVDFTDDQFSLSEIKELDELIDSNISEDFYIELPNNGYEYRIIDADSIDTIHYDTTVELIDECYLHGNDALAEGGLSNYITIDYQQICDDDTYGNAFASYDGEEESDNEYYYFRTN